MIKGDYFKQFPKAQQQFIFFLERISKIPVREEALLSQMGDALLLVCPEIGISKVEVVMEGPSNLVYPEGVTGRKLLFSYGVADLFNPLTKRFTTEEGGSVEFEIFWRRGNKESEEKIFWALLIMETLFLFMGRARISTMLNLSMRTDHPTGLPNVGFFFQKIEELVARGRTIDYAAIFFNVRNFKYINTLVNYPDGDAVMRQYAVKAKALLEPEEVIARLGGDNYVVLVHKKHLEEYLDGLDAIVVSVATPSGVKNINLQARCGIYLIDRPVRSPGEIMLPISIAQQVARESGNLNRVYYDRNMSKEVLEEKKIALDFGKGLEEGQFHAYYQPKVMLENGRLCGAEALARWEVKGQVRMPDDFIPIIEKDGSVCKLDFEILRQTCEMIASWKQKGWTPFPISVNMSRWHLRESDFVDQVYQIVSECGIEPKWIEIEITETLDYEEYQTMINVLNKLKEKGFLTSIDDFGSGYSSLTMLHKMDVDIIKLDQGFLWDEGPKRDILIRNIIRLAKELGIKVLAEGVETTAHRDFLIQNDCDMAQGFLYAMPLRRDEFEKRAFS
ncbi:MAG: GGDEF domain-containing phosphodiesterase [Lachnospiraceae bacterium]|nr:GGDEF domain-containing phosphodiesterase [Lachnospiraceae bacterium]